MDSMDGADTQRHRSGNPRFLIMAVLIALLVGAAIPLVILWERGLFEQQGVSGGPALLGPDSATNRPAGLLQEPDLSLSLPVRRRVQELEDRLDRIDLQADAVSGNAARAEGLLVAFAARRLLDRGEALGYLEDQLQLRFGNAQPNAVATIIATARNPVTLDSLRQRLAAKSNDVLVAPERLTGWDRVQKEVAELFVLRRSDAPSPRAPARLLRAQDLLDDGRVAAASALVEQLPNQQQTRPWLQDARRYVATQEALDLIETAALLEPRTLNDAEGQPIVQRSPAAPAPARAPAPAPADGSGASGARP
ncbi:hypothetical protein RM533_08320 [Croceicoccus sp. F390]|uniref:Uncharacterized protein n=1 Tax=Croceicoccus esteveae TaxID=3075597 RepID=A0ABU2ZHV7_9SPHN|nr:hypothetical protein [Croceicoccus sp. F390]MDT0576189.1 hypothetical protein [Croceicoccus sp. F390]